MSWSSLRVDAGAARDEVLAALFSAGALGVHEDGASLVTHFPPEADMPAIVAAVREASPDALCTVGRADDTDWSLAWRDRLRAHDLGAVTIAPPWLAEGLDPARTIVIDPGMAFGTGDHPTTRGAIRLLQQVMSPGLVVADLGAGSGVLAIAAAKLGASRVFAVEYDGEAIANAEENVRANGMDGVVHVFEGDAGVLLPLVAPVDLIVANIISSVLVELLPAMYQALRPGGIAVLAGILVDEQSSMLEALAADGWSVRADDAEENWWSVTIARP
ncbi:MAG: 50S ribosomal protein L11 methyltransferase [Gemmatimonadaceae bacterium]|nr:50S ribosomal protein L11 methyltransferase [Gemmatimonadaceae bacterium]